MKQKTPRQLVNQQLNASNYSSTSSTHPQTHTHREIKPRMSFPDLDRWIERTGNRSEGNWGRKGEQSTYPSLTSLGSGDGEAAGDLMSFETKYRSTPMRTMTTDSGIRTQSRIAVSNTSSSAIAAPRGGR